MIDQLLRHNSLLSLLQCPNRTEDATDAFITPHPSASFAEPFDDPLLEPVPFRTDGCQALGQWVTEAKDILSSTINLQQNMTFNIDGVVLQSGSTQGVCSPSCDNSSVGNHQRIDQIQQVGVEESVARFRPFQDEKWKATYRRLLEFKHKFGHCCVPHSYEEDRALARWVKRQRHQYKKFQEGDPTSTLTTSRLEQLEAIGFVWHSHAAAWMDKLTELKAFKASTGHCNVPSTYPANTTLSTWVKSQRRQYKLFMSNSPSSMTMLRYKVLKSLGFVFEPLNTSSK